MAANPAEHYDIGSAIGGFIAHLLSFRKNVFLCDSRPMDRKIPGITYLQGDMISLERIQDDSVMSLSSMDVAQKMGLGQYGETIEPDAWRRMLRNFSRVMRKGGMLYLSVPVGETDTIYFNRGRQFQIQTIIEALPDFQLLEFAGIIGRSSYRCIYLDDWGKYVYDDDALAGVADGVYGMFHFIKR